jgi:Domain of unknown function (DUF5665)
MDILNRKKRKEEKETLKRNHDEIAKALEILFATDYIDKKKLYLSNFLRGMAFSAGGVIGATIVIALLLWALSLFDNVPLIGPLLENTRQTIEQNQNTTN